MKQVPEVTERNETQTADQQMEILRNKLVGNDAFAACRGRLGYPAIQIATDLIGETGTPTSFLSKWDDFFSKARVMTNLLAQFNRDGMGVAYEELRSALESDEHFFPGETVPIEQTKPITVLMLEPKRTITFLRWLLQEHWCTLRGYLAWKDHEPHHPAHGGEVKEPSALTKQLYEQFPSLERHARECRGGYEGRELCRAFEDHVVSTFPKEIFEKGKVGELAREQWNDHIERVGDLPLIYIFEMEQSEVLKMLSRKDQKRVATWQFNLPKVIRTTYIGLHPQTIHKTLKKTQPALVSCGMSRGLGAVVLQSSPVSTANHPYKVAWNGSGEARTYGIVFNSFER